MQLLLSCGNYWLMPQFTFIPQDALKSVALQTSSVDDLTESGMNRTTSKHVYWGSAACLATSYLSDKTKFFDRLKLGVTIA